MSVTLKECEARAVCQEADATAALSSVTLFMLPWTVDEPLVVKPVAAEPVVRRSLASADEVSALPNQSAMEGVSAAGEVLSEACLTLGSLHEPFEEARRKIGLGTFVLTRVVVSMAWRWPNAEDVPLSSARGFGGAREKEVRDYGNQVCSKQRRLGQGRTRYTAARPHEAAEGYLDKVDEDGAD